MLKKLFFIFMLLISVFSFSKETIRIAVASYPMDEIVKIAAKDLEKQGYDVKISVLTDYVTANIGLNAKDFDANFHQHEPFMQIFNSKNNGNLVKIREIYNVYVGFYSKKYKSLDKLPKNLKIAIPNDPTNQDRALRILADYKMVEIVSNSNKLLTVKDVKLNKYNITFLQLPIPSLVQAYQEADLIFNWPAHMIKIGVSVKDALMIEKSNREKFAIILAAREDNKNSKKIKDLEKAMTSPKIKEFLEKEYKGQGYPMFK